MGSCLVRLVLNLRSVAAKVKGSAVLSVDARKQIGNALIFVVATVNRYIHDSHFKNTTPCVYLLCKLFRSEWFRN